MNRRWVRIGVRILPVQRSNRKFLKIVNFFMSGRQYMAIEQTAAKASYWAQLARKGHEVVQIKDVITGRFVAAVVDGIVKVYRDTAEAA